tara:strand:+ start:2974 stop:3204 length:231 start_codon:yes stop_codon:yes gene_type:complete
MIAIFVLSVYGLVTSAIVGAIFWLSQLYWQFERCKAGRESLIEMLERYHSDSVRLIAKRSMGTPDRIYDWQCETNE